eukprot:Protomagalhaensia_wolfi_Nauph_80__5996@NODE_813_length_1981_cov_3531_491761_g610_i0_p1_GENE_NODE_813_length_1981_cov_3531_491761_g610_i0NODE_813_length_1981_cov_3531_491761_g610_i0_p1_ORF_typecomplete_len326_score20_02_NODE_813_length_1981_cov_3531_491761_g610_i08781855
MAGICLTTLGSSPTEGAMTLFVILPQEAPKSESAEEPALLRPRVLSYALPQDFRVPTVNSEYPYLYRKPGRVFWWLGTGFGLEVAGVSQPDTGIATARAIRLAPRDRQAPQVATPPPAGWLVPRGPARRDDWLCYHPDLAGVKYASASKLTRETLFSAFPVRRLRFYPWGALVVADSLASGGIIAVLCIDEVDMRRIYGDRIVVALKGPLTSLARSELDVAAAPDLARVYLAFYGALVSQPVAPTASRVIFEVLSGTRPKIKAGQIHVAEGSPSGYALGDLNCLGVLAEFDPSTGLYYQAEISRLLCPRFVKLQEGAVAIKSSSE